MVLDVAMVCKIVELKPRHLVGVGGPPSSSHPQRCGRRGLDSAVKFHAVDPKPHPVFPLANQAEIHENTSVSLQIESGPYVQRLDAGLSPSCCQKSRTVQPHVDCNPPNQIPNSRVETSFRFLPPSWGCLLIFRATGIGIAGH